MKGQYKTYDAFEADFMLLFSNVEVRTRWYSYACYSYAWYSYACYSYA